MSVRVRFAPSPTGYLHIGGARTALFNWLYARHCGGRFILRIEDTDAARNTAESLNVILEGLRWLGLDWDEGPGDARNPTEWRGDHGPYFQSQRADIYRRHVESLLSLGHAYEKDGAVRFRMKREPVILSDLVVGRVERKLTDREEVDPDFVIVRSDGQPVFHLVNVVDDLEMGVTHVIRGEDHLVNTSKHVRLFEALGASPPEYGHIPLILNPDGSKMSKRDEGAALDGYREQGYLPQALVNYLCLLGWSPKDDRQVLDIREVVDRFDVGQILRGNARFDRDKLNWLNAEYMKQLEPEDWHVRARGTLRAAGVVLDDYPDAYVRAALETAREKMKCFSDLPAYVGFYFQPEPVWEAEAAAQHLNADSLAVVRGLREAFAGQEPFTAESLEGALKKVAADLGLKPRVVVHPLRVACTGSTVGPSLYHLLEVLGRHRVLAALDRALRHISPA